ncbi:MAG: hypothetical protein JSV16_03410 [Candidatus Hydrogenedentota bacterium]|nr:MAG: hypothetical protein JSV16_03410 [Candidatus Hydrogenedentota bacterium]
MPASKKQLTANRENATKSTGPTTDESKAAASQNAIKHGLYARDIIIDSPYLKEDPAEYERLLDSLTEELQPEGFFQESLVRKIANCLWRCRRATAAETARINRRLDGVETSYDYERLVTQIETETFDPGEAAQKRARLLSQLIGAALIPGESFSMNLLRYEMRLDRQLTQAYKLLNRLQKRPNFPSDKEKNGDP